jgi:hypothetical protein
MGGLGTLLVHAHRLSFIDSQVPSMLAGTGSVCSGLRIGNYSQASRWRHSRASVVCGRVAVAETAAPINA